MLSAVVFSVSSTTTAPFSSVFTPAASKLSPSVLGFLPIATRIASDSISLLLAPCEIWTYPFPFLSTISSIFDSSKNLIPFASNIAFALSAISSSSLGISLCAKSITVTSDPKSAYIEANSSPMYPAPKIVNFLGSSFSSIIEVLVYT